MLIGSAVHLSLTAHFASSIVAESVAVEYSGAGDGTTGHQFQGNSTFNRAPVCGGIQSWRGFSTGSDPCTGGPTTPTSGSITASTGSAVVILGNIEGGTPGNSAPWTSRLADAATGFLVSDQLGSGAFNGAMDATADPYHWALGILEIRRY